MTEESKALAIVEAVVASPLDMVPAAFRAGLERRSENRKTLIEWVRSALVEGVDFGKIHTGSGSGPKCVHGSACENSSHWSKDSLWKPGAEKICGMLNVIPTWPNLKDYESAALAGVEIKTIILRCEIVGMGGQVLGEGTGARRLSKDYDDLNKSLKMAKKSSLIDATLTMGGLSEVFTQDIEDMQGGQARNPEPTTPPAIGPDRARKFLAWSDAEGIARNHVLNAAKKYHGVEDLADLTEDQAKALMKHLKEGKKGANGAKGAETAQEAPQTPTSPPDPDSGVVPGPSASGAAEGVLFPPAADEESVQARQRFDHLCTTATAHGIPCLPKGKETCLHRLISECWTDRGDTDIWRIPVEVYDRVDARMTEIVAARTV